MFVNLAQRFFQGILVLFVLFTVTFFLIKALPGGPFKSAEKAIPEHIREKIEAYYGLDQPVQVQYFRQLKNLSQGDPGLSLRLEGREVTEIISQAFPVSVRLGLAAMAIAICIGIPLGVIAAWKKNTLLDYSAMAVAMIGICIPAFVIGPLLADQFGRRMNLLPAMGWDPTEPYVMDPARRDPRAGHRRLPFPPHPRRNVGNPQPGLHPHRQGQGRG